VSEGHGYLLVGYNILQDLGLELGDFYLFEFTIFHHSMVFWFMFFQLEDDFQDYYCSSNLSQNVHRNYRK